MAGAEGGEEYSREMDEVLEMVVKEEVEDKKRRKFRSWSKGGG